MSCSRGVTLISVLLALAACGRSHSGDSSHGLRVLDHEVGAARAGVGGAAAGSPAGMHGGGATSEARAEVAEALAQGPVVWIGQLRSFLPRTCAPSDPPISGRGPEFNPDGQFERVVIIAEGDPDTGALAVRVTIGEGVAPASPTDLPPLEAEAAFWQCFHQLPTRGFEYTGLDPFLSDDRLRFDLSPNELWNPWCESREFGCDGPCEAFPDCRACEAPPCQLSFPINLCHVNDGPACECANGECWADLATRYHVDLVVTPEGLEGASFIGDLRLRRVEP